MFFFFKVVRAGSADNTETKDVLVADFEGDSFSNNNGEESLWINGPTEDPSLELNETSSYNSTANELPEAKPLKQNRSELKQQNLSNRFQQEATDNPGTPQSCPPTDLHQPPCPTQAPQQQLCPPVVLQKPTCPPKDSKTEVPDVSPEQLSQLLELLKQLKPEKLQEEEQQQHQSPPHVFLPKCVQEDQQHGSVPKRLFRPKPHECLPKWSPVSPRHHGFPPDKSRHYDHQVQERLHQSAEVPQQYDPKPQPYGFHFLEPRSQSYPPREFREPHSYLPQEFWEYQPHGYQSRRPQFQPHEYIPQESQTHGYPVRDPMEHQMPQHEKPEVKPQVQRVPRFKFRWTASLPQRPHYVAIRPWHPANKAHFKTRQPSSFPQQFYYVAK